MLNGSYSSGPIVSFSWNFGDGTMGSGPIVHHTYSESYLGVLDRREAIIELCVADAGGTRVCTNGNVWVGRFY